MAKYVFMYALGTLRLGIQEDGTQFNQYHRTEKINNRLIFSLYRKHEDAHILCLSYI